MAPGDETVTAIHSEDPECWDCGLQALRPETPLGMAHVSYVSDKPEGYILDKTIVSSVIDKLCSERMDAEWNTILFRFGHIL